LTFQCFAPPILRFAKTCSIKFCAKRAFARTTKEAELTANAVLALFQNGFIEQSDLLVAAMRFIDRNGGWRKASPSENPAGRSGAGLRRRVSA
jgi:hypothetical protein